MKRSRRKTRDLQKTLYFTIRNACRRFRDENETYSKTIETDVKMYAKSCMRFWRDFYRIFNGFWSYFLTILGVFWWAKIELEKRSKKRGFARGLGGQREGHGEDLGGAWWGGDGEAGEDPARPAHPEGWAGGLYALRVTRRGHLELGGLVIWWLGGLVTRWLGLLRNRSWEQRN